MALSPGVYTSEDEVGTVVPDSGVGTAATVGRYTWGPCFQMMAISSPINLLETVKAPTRNTAYSYLSTETVCRVSNDVRVVRVVDEETAANAVPTYNMILPTIVSGGTNYQAGDVINIEVDSTVIASGEVTAVDGTGVITGVSVPATTDDISTATVVVDSVSGTGADITIERLTDTVTILNDAVVESVLSDSALRSVHTQLGVPAVFARYPGEHGNKLTVDIASFEDLDATSSTAIQLTDRVTGETTSIDFGGLETLPTKVGQFAVIVREEDQVAFQGTISLNEDDRNLFGQTMFISDLADQGRLGPITASDFGWSSSSTGRYNLKGGENGDITSGMYQEGWAMMSDSSQVPAQVMFAGPVCGEDTSIAATVCRYARDNIAALRGDTLFVMGTPPRLIVGLTASAAVDAEIAYRRGEDSDGQAVANNVAGASKRGTYVHNAKWTYDRFNDRNFWMDISADKAARIVQVLSRNIPWQSASGTEFGRVNSISKLAYNPDQGNRDRLYVAGINPVVLNEGIFYIRGDKTMWPEPSSFSRENVVQVFNKMKVDISRSAATLEFKQNTESVRRQYKNETDAYMRGIQARGGLEDFRNIVDSLNPPEVRARNEFRARHAIKPVYSVNFVILQFTAVGPSVDFEELEG